MDKAQIEIRGNALINELANQRSMLGDRAAELAAELAQVKVELHAAKARIADLEKKDAPELKAVQ